MSSVLHELGLDIEDLEWQDVALCRGMPTNRFHDEYEQSEQVARAVDEACLSCPVMSQCLLAGVENNEWGVWGGIYLVSGRVDANRNAHKTPDIWEQVRERIGGNSVF